ncbi:MAG: DUF6291 domain-containing protein, partial [Prevotellaceae bacterium]|nr:DUF6291 domain-containing protein [Prevotellaceae bacterium]
MADDRFTFFRSYITAVERLPARQQLETLKAIIYYALDGAEPESPTPTAAAILDVVKPIVDGRPKGAPAGNVNNPYGRNGKPRETPDEDEEKKQINQIKQSDLFDLNQIKQTVKQINQEQETETETEVETEVETETENMNQKQKQKRKRGAGGTAKAAPGRTVFVPPTLQEVMDYCHERDSAVDPVAFWSFYESKGWLVGKSPMKNWKMAVVTWERGDGRGGGGPA